MQSKIPYIVSEGDLDNQIQDEIEIASVLLIALSRQDHGKPDAIVKINYPFSVYESEDGDMVFDLLEVSKTERKWLLPTDLSENLTELESSKTSEEILDLLGKGKELMSQEPEHGSTLIEGMVEQEDLRAYLIGCSHVIESEDSTSFDLFKPVLTKKRFASIRKNVKSLHKGIQENILSTDQCKERIVALTQAIKKKQDKKLSTFKKESEKKLVKYEKEKDKSIKDIEKILEKEKKDINEDFNSRLKDKTDVIDIVKETIIGLEEQRKTSGDRDTKNELRERKKTLNRLKKEVQVLEDEHGKKLSEVEIEAESQKQICEEEHQKRTNEEENQLNALLETHEKTLSGCEELEGMVSEMSAKMTEDAEKLSRVLDVKYGKGKNLNIPFYIFRYSEGDYGYHPPVKVSEEKSIGKTLKLMLTNNVGNKISQFVSPQTHVFDVLIANVIDSLNDETELAEQFKNALSSSNILESREKLDKIMIGLYKVMEWNWVNEKDYIEVQKFLLEKLDTLNGGNVFGVPREENEVETEVIMDTPESIEIPVSE